MVVKLLVLPCLKPVGWYFLKWILFEECDTSSNSSGMCCCRVQWILNYFMPCELGDLGQRNPTFWSCLGCFNSWLSSSVQGASGKGNCWATGTEAVWEACSSQSGSRLSWELCYSSTSSFRDPDWEWEPVWLAHFLLQLSGPNCWSSLPVQVGYDE